MDKKSNKTLKTIKQYIESYKKPMYLPKKFFMVNNNKKHLCFEDLFLIGQNRDVKVSQIKVAYVPNNYIKGIQFTYKTLKGKKQIDGFNMTIFKKKTEMKIVTLADDEFLIEVFGRKGSIIDNIGFKTNKGNVYSFGGTGGTPFSFIAKEGYHLSLFAGSCGDCDDSLSNLTFEMLSLPGQSTKTIDFNLSKSKNIIRLAMDFLSINENLDLFLLNKEFSKLRYDHYILGNFWTRIIYSCNNQLRSYIKKMVKGITNRNILQDIQTIINLVKFSKNKISNSYGKKKFNGWKVRGSWKVDQGVAQRHKNSAFICNYDPNNILIFKGYLKNLFDSEQLTLFNEGLNHIVVGTNIGSTWHDSSAGFSCILYDENDKKILERQYNKDYSNSPYEHISFKFRKTPNVVINSIEITISGTDRKYWNGYFGPSISGTYIRILPNDQYFEKFYKETSLN